MKILLASESYWPNIDGGAIAQRQLVQRMTARGYTIIVWAPGNTLHSYTEYDGQTLIYRERSIANPTNPRYRFSLWPFSHAFRIIHAQRPDVVHVQTPFQIGLATIVAARYYRIPIIATNHVMPENILPPSLPRGLYRLLEYSIWRYIVMVYNLADIITAPSLVALSYLQKYHIKPPARVISNGIDLNQFLRAPLPKLEPPTLLYVGRHDPEKNLMVLLMAIKLLRDKNTQFQLVTVGIGTDLPRLTQYVRTHHLESFVTFRGFVSEAEKLDTYYTSDIFVIPSPAELQSLVTMEAMGCGLPVIAANAGALPDLVQQEVTGFLFHPDNPQELADYCVILLSSATMREQFGRAGSAAIKHDHQISYTFDQNEQVYQDGMNYVLLD